MNWDTIAGRWKEFSGKVRQQWDKLSDDEIGQIGGKKDELVGSLQKHYGYAKDDAHRAVDDFTNGLRDDNTATPARGVDSTIV
jgi:uncharacterized protein YjbJ (UPF0337 family)